MTELARQVIDGDRRALARAITLAESTRADHRAEAEALLEEVLPHAGGAVRVGISGAPGAGKSTFIEALGTHLVGVSSQAAGHKTLIPELIAQLRKQGGDDILVVAGGVIPAQDYDELRDAGVAAIFGPGTNIPNAAAEIVRLLRRA